MKGKMFLQISIILLIGVISANYIYNRYKTEYVINTENIVYILQEGVYIDKSSIRNITAPFIIEKQDMKYYTYLGMTLNYENATKIKELYKNQNINLYIKEVSIENHEFLSELSQYDILLANSSNYGEVSNILNTILSTYQEIVK